MSTANFPAANTKDCFISGRGLRVVYSADSHSITLYLTKGSEQICMSKAYSLKGPVVNGREVTDFTNYFCKIERKADGIFGEGERMTISSNSQSTQLTRHYILESSAAEKGLLYIKTIYKADGPDVCVDEFIENVFELANVKDTVWSYNGGGESPLEDNDTVKKIDLTSPEPVKIENRQDYTSAAIPAADIYTAAGGIAIGDASAKRREVRTPVEKTKDSVKIYIQWPGKTIKSGSSAQSGQCFAAVHEGDFFCGLRAYKTAMEYIGVVMQKDIAQRSYDLRWEGWGWGFDWSADLIIRELDFLKEAGVKQITIDDAWYDHPGDWQLSTEKFPNGEADMKKLTKAIHDHGMSALLWWRPCDGGRDDSRLHQEHPEYFVMREDKETAKLGTSGRLDTDEWSSDTGYALCPASDGAIEATTAFINRAMKVWGFDGFKGDFVWSLPKCYNPSHNHPYPEDSTESQAEIYRAAHEAMLANDINVFNLLCNCSAPQDYYSMPYMTQVVTADPASVDQTRTRLKAYKALMGDFFPVTTDHFQPWYSSAVGTGAVLIEKTAYVNKEKEEYKRWLKIADTMNLHKGRFIGGLYSYGFDPYETYVVEKDGVMHYAFFRDGEKCKPNGYPPIEVKGLEPDKMYRITDYANGRVVATNVMGDNALINVRFVKDLLLKAVEITVPDTDTVDVNWGFTVVKDNDAAVKYTENTAELTFTGACIRWYGSKTADSKAVSVYIDGELAAQVNNGSCEEKNVLLFEALDIPEEKHTLRLESSTGLPNIEYFAYEPAPPQIVFDKRVDSSSELIKYSGRWEEEHDNVFNLGSAKLTSDEQAYAEFVFVGSAVRWYGKRTTDYGVAWAYIDGELAKTVFAYGPEETNEAQLLFEIKDLKLTEHTLRIVRMRRVIHIDYLTYASE